MVVFVQRNVEGAIIGVFANFQADIAEEQIDDADPEVEAFLHPPPILLDQDPSRCACVLRVVVENEEVIAVAGSFRVAGIIFLSTGSFLAIFSLNLGEVEPFVVPNNGVSIAVAEWGGDYAVIEIREHAGGELVTPSSFGFSLYNF